MAFESRPPNNVFQWLGEVTEDAAYIQCLRRDFDPTVPTIDAVFDPTDHLIETIARRVFEAEAAVTLNILAAKFNKEKKEELRELMDRHDEEGAAEFSSHFDPILQRESKRSRGGYVLLQPHAAVRSEPPLTIAGNRFPVDGSQVSPRIKLLVEKDDGYIPLSITPAATTPGTSEETAVWTDFRMIAGSLNQTSSKMMHLLQALSNMLIGSILLVGDVQFPTILDSSILDRFEGTEYQSLMYLFAERIVRDVNVQIEQRAITARSDLSIANVKTITGDARLTMNLQPYLKDILNEIDIALDSLKEDPILFVMGPALSKYQMDELGSDGNVIIQRIPDDKRARMFPGFDPSQFEALSPDPSLDIPIKFSTESVDLWTSVNTLYNLLVNPKTSHMAVRLSHWTDALTTIGPAITERTEANTSSPSITSKRWMSDVVKPHIESRFRAHIIIPPSSTDGLVADVIDDSRFLKFEKHIHEGDTSTYIKDVVDVIKMALEFLFVEARDVRSGMDIKQVPVADLYNGVMDGVDGFIPFFDMPRLVEHPYTQYETVDTSIGPDIQMPSFNKLDGTPSVSAASSFLARYMGIAASTPMKAAYPDREKISQFLAKSSPIAVTNNSVRKFIDSIITQIVPDLTQKFENCLVFKNDESGHDTDYVPYSCNFDRSESPDFKYTSGSEVNQVVEGMMMAIHLANSLSNQSEIITQVPVITTMGPISLSLSNLDLECKSRAVNMHESTPSLIVKNGTTVINPTRYARFLEMTSPNSMNNAGNCVFSSGLSSLPPVKGVVGTFYSRFPDIPVMLCRRADWFPTDASRLMAVVYTLYESTNMSYKDQVALVASSAMLTELAAWKVNLEPVNIPIPTSANTFSNAFALNLGFILGSMTTMDIEFDANDVVTTRTTSAQTTYTSKVHISIPLWAHNELVGYAVFSKIAFRIEKTNTITLQVLWDSTYLHRIVCLQRGAITKIASPLGTDHTYWAFTSNVTCGLKLSSICPIMKFTKNVPIWYTPRNATAILEKNSAYNVDTRSPMKYSLTNKTKVDSTTLKRMLVDGLNGLHFSSLKNGPHTEFAVAVGATADRMRTSLNATDPRRLSPICVDSGGTDPIAVVLNELYTIHLNSSTRSTDIPLVTPVRVIVRGPGAMSTQTRCIVYGKGAYLRRTGQFNVIESTLINRLKVTVNNAYNTTQYNNNVGSIILKHPDRITSIDTVLAIINKSQSPSIITRLIIAIATSSKIGDQTGRARDRRALDMLATRVESATRDVLMCPLANLGRSTNRR